MPKNSKSAPPQQANLMQMWKKKPEKDITQEPNLDAFDAMQVDPNARSPSSNSRSRSKTPQRMELDPPAAGSSKRTQTPSQEPLAKKRKITDEDEEMDERPAAKKPTQATNPSPNSRAASKKPASQDAQVKEDPNDHEENDIVSSNLNRRRHVPVVSDEEEEPQPLRPTRKQIVEEENRDEEEETVAPSANSRGRGKRVVKSDSEEEEKESSLNRCKPAPKKPAASSSPKEKGKTVKKEEEDDEDDDLLENDDIPEKTVTSKIAEAALSKRDLVDLKGGWKVGAPVPYAALTKTFAHIEATTKRLEKTALLTAFLLLVIERSAPNDTTSLLQAVYLCINRLSPDYIGVELGIGESLLIKAIVQSTGRSLAIVKADLKREGDLGLVAMASKNSQSTLGTRKALTLPLVFSNLRDIAMTSGNSSQAKKVGIITKLLASCQDFEAKYIIRSLEGKLRIGNAERSVLVALSHAAVLAERANSAKKWSPEKTASRMEEGAEIVKAVYSELPSYDKVIPAILTFGIDGLREQCKLTPGVPLKPMLAKPTKAIGEVLDRFEGKRFTCEYKYDGERAQVHLEPNGTVSVFSRNSEDMSKKYPDLVEQLPGCIKSNTKSFVLDAEAVAIDRVTGKLLPFQELSKRKRKDVKVEDIQVRVCLFAFDLLYLNGEPLLQMSLDERRGLLRDHFNVVPGEFEFAKWSDSETVDEIQTFLEDSVKDGCEGLMVKMLETDASYYEPSRRSVNWLKLKKDYLAGVGDSLDLVVVGAYFGKGKRTNVYGAFLLACYDADSEEYQTICKIGTGFSEEILQTHYDTLKELEVSKVRGDIKVGGAKPDVWFEPKIVWEVLTADLSLSPIYTAGQGLVEDKGISLRFPRFLRIRDDKNADDATSSEQVAEMYERQALATKGGRKKKGGDGEDADDGFW